MFILPPAAVADAVGKLPDGSSLGEVLGKAGVGIVVDMVLFGLSEGNLTRNLHPGIRAVVLAGKHEETLERFLEGNLMARVVGKGGFVGELPVQLVVAQGLLVELVSTELIFGLMGLLEVLLLVGTELMGVLVVKLQSMFIGKLEGKFVGEELVGKLAGMLVGKYLVGKLVGNELVGKLTGKSVGRELVGKELVGKEVGKEIGKEVVGKFLGKERVGKRAPQLQLGLSLRLLLIIS